MDSDSTSGLLSLDLSAAFYTIDLCIPLHRLEKQFGVSGRALTWLKSYLSWRTVFPAIMQRDVKWGVAQGSVLDPLLFYLFSIFPLLARLYAAMEWISTLHTDDTWQICHVKADEHKLSNSRPARVLHKAGCQRIFCADKTQMLTGTLYCCVIFQSMTAREPWWYVWFLPLFCQDQPLITNETWPFSFYERCQDLN